MLIFHIGLPKTGSTFLQHRVFNRQDRYAYVDSSVIGPLQKALRRYIRATDREVEEWRRQVIELMPAGDVLVSDENIAMNAREPWTGEGQVPSVTARRLAGLTDSTGPVGVIVGIRRQDTWLASRYSESAGVFSTFSQSDFDERVSTILTDGPRGVLAWLDYYESWRAMCEVVGDENVFMLPMESLADGLLEVLRGLEGFFGSSGLVAAYESGKLVASRRNALAVGAGQWRMRAREDGLLSLKEVTSQAIRAHFSASNQSLSEQTGLLLDRLGYH